MTLLVLDLHLPAAEAIYGERDLWRALTRLRPGRQMLVLAPQSLVYMMSFLTPGIFCGLVLTSESERR